MTMAKSAMMIDSIVGISYVLRGVRESMRRIACVVKILAKSTRSPFGVVVGLTAAMRMHARAHETAGKISSAFHAVKTCNINPTIDSPSKVAVGKINPLLELQSKPSESSFGSSTNELIHTGFQLPFPHLLRASHRTTNAANAAGIAVMYGSAHSWNLAFVWS